MKLFLKILFWIIIGSLIISGLFGLMGTLLGITFGIIGTVMKIVWKLAFNPVVLILIVVYLAYRLKQKAS